MIRCIDAAKIMEVVHMPLNNLNKTLTKVNRTLATVSRTQNTVRNVSNQADRSRRQRTQKANERAADNAWKCSCGQSNQTNFCGGCGSAPAVCPNCDIIVDSKFCPDCGTEPIKE